MTSRFTMAALGSLLIALLAAAPALAATEIPTPESLLGFTPGADGHLMDYEQLITSVQAIAEASDRIEMVEVGRSPQDRPIYLAFLSSPENLARLDALREINRSLALNTTMSVAESLMFIDQGRVFVYVTLSMHSSEVGPSQMLPLFAHEIATTEDPAMLSVLDNVVVMVVPCHNPDGMDMVVQHYRTTKNTPYEGSSLPGLYHEYIGHDNNRDFVSLTQADTRVIDRIASTEWYPQVLVEKHQMGSTGPRYFVPPNHDPIAENVPPELWQWMSVFGANLSRDMGADGLTGVASHYLFDNYWPGSTETPLWKNVIAFLTEAASCRLAAPVFVEPTELAVWGKGLSEYDISVNMPAPWPGGWWRLSDIIRYELSSMRSILRTASQNRREILQLRNDLARDQVEQGRTEPPFAYLLPRQQHDPGRLADVVELLQRHGVQVSELIQDVQLGDHLWCAGDIVIDMAQPYRPFIKEVMEAQQYPVRRYEPGGEAIRPYDITSWSLPLHAGLLYHQISADRELLEIATTPVTSPWTPAPHMEDLSTPAVALACPARSIDCFQLAFAALDAGLEVTRTTAPTAHLAPGTFLVAIDGQHDTARQLIRPLRIAPTILDELPDVDTVPLSEPRIALVETWRHDMDAGWTRFLLDSLGVKFTRLRPEAVADASLAERFDVLLFPDSDADIVVSGKRSGTQRSYRAVDLAPAYREGLGAAGLEACVKLLEAGGTIVSWGRSTEVVLDHLDLPAPAGLTEPKGTGEESSETPLVPLPARDISDRLAKQGLRVPGALLAVNLLGDHPLTWGLPDRVGVFSQGRPLFATSIPVADTDRRVIAVHPDDDILMSGYAEHEELLANVPAMVWLRKGPGQIVLFGFQPQFRASTPATFPLLLNALLLPPADNPALKPR